MPVFYSKRPLSWISHISFFISCQGSGPLFPLLSRQGLHVFHYIHFIDEFPYPAVSQQHPHMVIVLMSHLP